MIPMSGFAVLAVAVLRDWRRWATLPASFVVVRGPVGGHGSSPEVDRDLPEGTRDGVMVVEQRR